MYMSVIASGRNTVAASGSDRPDAARQDRREEIDQRAGDRTLIYAGPDHDQLFEQTSRADAHALLHVGDFGLDLRVP